MTHHVDENTSSQDQGEESKVTDVAQSFREFLAGPVADRDPLSRVLVTLSVIDEETRSGLHVDFGRSRGVGVRLHGHTWQQVLHVAELLALPAQPDDVREIGDRTRGEEFIAVSFAYSQDLRGGVELTWFTTSQIAAVALPDHPWDIPSDGDPDN